ncbi:MAG: flagellar basal body P-ring protein FlgI [Phycisphaerales bacterium]|nr:flagellar basal body P-ring protein FlgI [Phycisphaerales bacterium]
MHARSTVPRAAALLAVGLLVAGAVAQVRVQDVARLQGQRTNKLMGFGLVVGLPGTGDGEKYVPTIRALMKLHERHHAPVLNLDEVKGNKSIALVVVEATIPEFGAREGQTIDVTVSTLGTATRLTGGQLLTTPLQYAALDPEDPGTWTIFALAGGRVTTPDASTPTRGLIAAGAVLEEDVVYNFLRQGVITLVLDDTHADFTWANLVARSINHELSGPLAPTLSGDTPDEGGLIPLAHALDAKNVLVHVPPYEQGDLARFISRVQQAPLFDLPEPAALVTIDRATRNVAFTASVRVSPAVLQIPGLGTLRIGAPREGEPETAPPDTTAARTVGFDELFRTLSAIQATPDQIIDAIEHLHRAKALHARIQYR